MITQEATRIADAITIAQATICARHTKHPRVTIPHRIIIRATREFITTGSKKTLWKTRGHAQAALRGDLEQIFRSAVYKGALTHQEAKAATQEFIDTVVEFVPYILK